ncbi:hypothetical protein KD050_13140 [Psychrobacillus sp. INOP01]|nr:hypothetical protein KD050_13140 [Psychrobacillus sp. INOP01]
MEEIRAMNRQYQVYQDEETQMLSVISLNLIWNYSLSGTNSVYVFYL